MKKHANIYLRGIKTIPRYNYIPVYRPALKFHVTIAQVFYLYKKEAVKTKGYCEALSYIVLAEFSYLHSRLIADLQTTFGEMLAQQAEFHTAVSSLMY